MMTVQQPRHHLRPRQLRPSPSSPQQPLRRSPRGLRRLQSSRPIRRQQQKHRLRPRQLRPPPLPPHQPLRRSTMRWPCRSKLQQAAASCSKLQQAAGSVFLPHSTTRRRGERLQINYTRVLRVPLVQHSSSCSTVCASCCKNRQNLSKTRPVHIIQESQNDPKVKNTMGFPLING